MKNFIKKVHYMKSVKKATIIRMVIAVCLALILTLSIASVSHSENISAGLGNSLIRLHVIANSDSDADQALKRDVRDLVLRYMKENEIGGGGLEATKESIREKLAQIEELALEEISRQGFQYKVKAEYGDFLFPVKAYGDIVLPAGKYQALRIQIGKGEGANWWCVLFPPLCFVDATHGAIPDDVKEELKEVLTDEEYSIVTSADSEKDIPVNIKFKIVDVLKESKGKVLGFLTKLFGFGE